MVFFSWGLKLHAVFSVKSRKMVSGHKVTIEELKTYNDTEYVWFHAASLGEFEQGRPLIESIKKNYPNQKILLTFFSPSGYEVRKNYPFVDEVLYLPIDTSANARFFLTTLNIKVAIFIKYEFWFNYLSLLNDLKIPTFYVSTVFRNDQIYFKSNWMLGLLKNVNHFFLQNKDASLVANENGIERVTITGDTRLDSVLLNVKEEFECPEITSGLDGRQVIVFGSTWAGDTDLIIPFINKYGSKYQYIIAPHEIQEGVVNELQSKVKLKTARLSKSEKLEDVLIIDSIGKLKYIYRYASLAYVGGGFNKSIHNTLEPLVYGIPVLFGPRNFKKFQEAICIVDNKMGRVIKKDSFNDDLAFYLNSEKNRKEVASRVEKYISENKGAAEKVLKVINPLLESQ